MKYLVSGNSSGLGKYLYENLEDCSGFGRNDSLDFDTKSETTIVHCAFNKSNKIDDYYKYLNDNIFLTQYLLENCQYKKFVYISSIEVYSEDQNLYSTFKKFAESVVAKFPNTLILRCPTLLGYTMKPNHIHKIKEEVDNITLSEHSTFCYMNMEKIKDFLSNDIVSHNGIIDFVPTDETKLHEIKEYFKSKTELGNYTYKSNTGSYVNPIYNLGENYKWSSFDNFVEYVASI